MAEPEELLIEGAHRIAEHGAALWRRARPSAPDTFPALKERLAFVLEALCPGAPPLVVADPPATPTWVGRLARRTPGHLVDRRALPSTDGTRIRLPDVLDDERARVPGAYTVIAVAQALRARRARSHIEGARRDLDAIAEAADVERQIVKVAPGLRDSLVALRAIERAARPRLELLTPLEREVEERIRALLESPPESPPASSEPVVTGAYRGVPPVFLWGRVDAAEGTARKVDAPGESGAAPPNRTGRLARRPRVRETQPGEDDAGSGAWMVPTSDRQESIEDPMGLVRPGDRDDAADPGGLADSLSELPEARLVRTPGAPREVLISEDPPARTDAASPAGAGSGFAYPEWDWRSGTYARRAFVRIVAVPEGRPEWVEEVFLRNASLVRRTRRTFERLRPRRVRLRRQLEGDEIDIDACIEDHADRRSGWASGDRLYAPVRPLRHELALLVLVDASSSTDAWVDGGRRIIDVEKEALIVLSEAMAVMGDPLSILAFSGEGPSAVRVATLKEFRGRVDRSLRLRIAGLEPDRFTRMGAALRHATAVLAAQRVAHRLLLVLSDGRPNDDDEYEGKYGIEDTRQAVHEARAEGIHPFCIAVRRGPAGDMPRIFGRSGFAVARRVDTLPSVLLDAVRRLLR